jgi:hypothetical protein
MKSLKEQWAELLPHIKAHIVIQFGTALLTSAIVSGVGLWVAHLLERLVGGPKLPTLFYLALALLFFCAILLANLLSAVAIKPSTTTIAPAPQELPAPTEAIVLPPIQKPVDFHGRFLEIYFSKPDPLPITSYFVLVKLEMVNRGPDEATASFRGIVVSLPGYKRSGGVHQFPEWWRIRRRKPDTLLPVYEELPCDPQLGLNPHEEIYRKGIPRVGWIAFEMYLPPTEEFHNAQMDIHVHDSLGGTHVIRRELGVYYVPGELLIDRPAEKLNLTG